MFPDYTSKNKPNQDPDRNAQTKSTVPSIMEHSPCLEDMSLYQTYHVCSTHLRYNLIYTNNIFTVNISVLFYLPEESQLFA